MLDWCLQYIYYYKNGVQYLHTRSFPSKVNKTSATGQSGLFSINNKSCKKFSNKGLKSSSSLLTLLHLKTQPIWGDCTHVTSAWIENQSTLKSIVRIWSLYGLKMTIKHYIVAKFELKRDLAKVISEQKFYIFSVNLWEVMFVSLPRGTKMADEISKFKIVHSLCHKQSKCCHII